MKHLITLGLTIVLSQQLTAKTPLRCFDLPTAKIGLYSIDKKHPQKYSKALLITDKRADISQEARIGVIIQTPKGRYIDTANCMSLEDNRVFDHELKSSYLWCALECDAGGIAIDRDIRHATLLDMTLGYHENEEEDVSLVQYTKTNEIKLTEIKCPSVAYDARDSDGYYSVTALSTGKYVCYDNKSKGKNPEYFGCGRFEKSCRSQRLQRFGKYSSISSAKDALYRCQTSKPRFVSAPIEYAKETALRGKYICYDYKSGDQNSPQYHNCIQSIDSCRDIHKSKFGLYPSSDQAKEALGRCGISKPR